MEALVTLLPNPDEFPPIVLVGRELCKRLRAVKSIRKTARLAFPPAFCPGDSPRFELLPLSNDEFPKDELPNVSFGRDCNEADSKRRTTNETV